MFQKILVPLDGSELAERALTPAAALSRAAKGELFLVSIPYLKHLFVQERSGYGMLLPHQSIEHTRQELVDYLQKSMEQVDHPDVQIHSRIEDGDEASVIIDTAVSEGVDLIVMSTHGRTGFARWYMGSVTERVLQSAPCPVLVVRESQPLSRILITLDGSLLSEQALEPGFALAQALDAEVTLLRVEQPEELDPHFVVELEAVEHGLGEQVKDAYYFQIERYLSRLADKYQHLCPQKVKTASPAGPVARGILHAIEAGEFDLVVMATHGRTGLRRWAYGSITEKIMRHAPCAVLIIRPLAKV